MKIRFDFKPGQIDAIKCNAAYGSELNGHRLEAQSMEFPCSLETIKKEERACRERKHRYTVRPYAILKSDENGRFVPYKIIGSIWAVYDNYARRIY